ncbi:MAG: hypothetical protein F4236_09190, partial [Acidimicrobiia bacterium]|nr:hypothetical protein [Acidimicrobiia bacterium]
MQSRTCSLCLIERTQLQARRQLHDR